jgi:hypothetical protein
MAVEATEVRCGGEVRSGATAVIMTMLMSCAGPSPLAC